MTTSSFRLILASAVALSTLSPTDVGAVQTVAERRIPREPECLRCRIVIGPPRVIGADDGPGSLEGAVWSGARDSKGNYYLVAGPSQPPLKFDPSGRFIVQLGRMGPGPGEFEGLSSINVVGGDSVYVTDRRSVHVFAPSGDFVRSDIIPVVARIPVVRMDGSAVVAGSAQTSSGAGRPFHFLGRGMDVVTKSFGSTLPESASFAPLPGRLAMAASRDRGFWTVQILDYRLTQWDSTGKPLQVLEADPTWWTTPPETSRRDTAVVAPRTGIRRVFEDSNGLLWVATLIPGASWREGYGRRQPDGTYLVKGMRFDLLHDTMLEVIDPRSARLLTSAKIPGYVSEFLGAGEILQSTEDASGIPRAIVRTIRLDR